MKTFLPALVLTIATLVTANLAYGEVALKSDHPDTYLVQKGDTLWDIASMFLTDAWLWPEIWHVNPNIENPHLIFPGDKIRLRYVDGKPQLSVERGAESRTVTLSPGQAVRKGDRNQKLQPKIRVSPLVSAIPAISLDTIAGMLTSSRIVEKDTLENAPYILAGKADALVFGPGDIFYGRGDWQEDTKIYGIFREGNVYRDPETHEIIGYEAREVGSGRVLARDDDVLTFELSSVKEDVRLGDRLMPTEERRVESTFYPKPPGSEVEGEIMAVLDGVTSVGRDDVIVLNRGLQNDLDVGDILAVHKRGKVVKDRLARKRKDRGRVKLPIERSGIVMIFRSFDRMSYALVLETEEPLKVGDIVENP